MRERKKIKKRLQDKIVERTRDYLTNNFFMEEDDFYFSDISVNNYPILFCKDALLYGKICKRVENALKLYQYEYGGTYKDCLFMYGTDVQTFGPPDIRNMLDSGFNIHFTLYTCKAIDKYDPTEEIFYGLNVVVEDEFFNSLKNDAKRWEVFLKLYNKPSLMELFGDKIKEMENKK